MSPPPRTLRGAADLVASGLAPPERLAELERVAARYAVAITPAMADLVDPADPADPIAAQFVPRAEELDPGPGEAADPIGDHPHSPVPGLVHRYPDRVLLKLVHVCPVYCRFCFRREMVGPEGHGTLTPAQVAAALAYIAERPGIWEVILTGGDPLMLSPARVAAVMRGLRDIPHVEVVRVHSRVPVASPERIDALLVRALRQAGKAVYLVLHANHPRELTPAARAACARLVDGGVPLLSQSVLLRGVNDDAETLGALMRAFVACRIKPYYLHQLDHAPGTGHFRVPIREGQALVGALRGRLSGLCQPAYMLDIPGGHGKVPIGPSYLADDPAGPDRYRVTDPSGQAHAYPPSDPTGAAAD